MRYLLVGPSGRPVRLSDPPIRIPPKAAAGRDLPLARKKNQRVLAA